MCQGVIGIVEPQTMAVHWGVGSHTDLIKKLWPNSATNAGDKLVKFEADLVSGPGKFNVEGCEAAYTQEMKDFIHSELLGKVPDFAALAKYILDQDKFDMAFVSGVLYNNAFYKFEDYFSSYNSNSDAYKAKKLAFSFGSDADMVYKASMGFENEIAKQRADETAKVTADYIAFAKTKYGTNSFTDSATLCTAIENLKTVQNEINALVSRVSVVYDNKLAIARTMFKIGGTNDETLKKLRAEKAAAMTAYFEFAVGKLVEIYNSDPDGAKGIVRKVWAKKAETVEDTTPKGAKKLPKIGKGTVVDPNIK